MIGRQYMVDWVTIFVKSNWVLIGRQYYYLTFILIALTHE
jgi:hypothetical protein